MVICCILFAPHFDLVLLGALFNPLSFYLSINNPRHHSNSVQNKLYHFCFFGSPLPTVPASAASSIASFDSGDTIAKDGMDCAVREDIDRPPKLICNGIVWLWQRLAAGEIVLVRWHEWRWSVGQVPVSCSWSGFFGPGMANLLNGTVVRLVGGTVLAPDVRHDRGFSPVSRSSWIAREALKFERGKKNKVA